MLLFEAETVGREYTELLRNMERTFTWTAEKREGDSLAREGFEWKYGRAMSERSSTSAVALRAFADRQSEW